MEDCITLSSGVEMPRIGYGVYQVAPSSTKRCVDDALKADYRSIDTAQCYGNEAQVGEAVRESALPRAEVFVTTKLWGCSGYRDAERSIDESIRRLGLGAIDLLLIHEPTGNVREIYRAMEDALAEGKVRAIGVSNFMEREFASLVDAVSIVPAVNQVEMHVLRQQDRLRALLREAGTQAESWSPLASGKSELLHNGVLEDVARAHGRTSAQVALRFLYQQDVVVIPRSMRPERMAENRDIRFFTLTDDEMERIRALDEGKSLFGWW